MAIHKGTELNNVNETWNQNERLKESGNTTDTGDTSAGVANVSNDLQQTIREEAAEYDKANKEERILGGERATVRDNEGDRGSGE